MYAVGLGHKISLDSTAYLKTTLANTYSRTSSEANMLHAIAPPQKMLDVNANNQSLIFNSYLHKKFGARHSNRTGVTVTGLFYDMDYKASPSFPNADLPIKPISKSNGSTTLISAFSNSTVKIGKTLTANVGVAAQLFTLNNSYFVEPRAGFKWQFAPKHILGFGYGLHSRHENISYYFVQVNGQEVNKNLKLAKAHHVILSYDWNISNNMHLKIEPYYQHLFNIPVSQSGAYAVINQKEIFIDIPLVNKGFGRNYGIDITFEKYLTNGYYYMFTGSVFDSKYKTTEGIWRNTKFNRSYIVNLLGGKEWIVKNKNIWSANARLTYQGGDYYTPIDQQASLASQHAVLNEAKAYTSKLDPALLASFTASYKINNSKTAHQFSFMLINATGHKKYQRHVFNYKTKSVEATNIAIIMANISYRIHF